MKITEVHIKLVSNPKEKLRAFCSVTLDNAFAIRDMKIIETSKGLLLAMPSRRLGFRCPHCHSKNHLRAHYCNECGSEVLQTNLPTDETGRLSLYADIAYPVNSSTRDLLQRTVLQAYMDECRQSETMTHHNEGEASGGNRLTSSGHAGNEDTFVRRNVTQDRPVDGDSFGSGIH